MPDAIPQLDHLATPLAWLDGEGRLLGCNPAFASWLGVSARRLVGMSLQELDAETDRVAGLMPRLLPTGEPLRVRRARLAFPGGPERIADVWLARTEDGGLRLEAHPADEFPGEDPATALPAALSAALKGLAHEIRNPLAGMKGAAQLLARRVEGEESTELVQLISAEVDRLVPQHLMEFLAGSARALSMEGSVVHAE